jgi:hypothetical protein
MLTEADNKHGRFEYFLLQWQLPCTLQSTSYSTGFSYTSTDGVKFTMDKGFAYQPPANNFAETIIPKDCISYSYRNDWRLTRM